MFPPKKLGKPKDDKMFTYTYTGNDPSKNIYESKSSGFQQTNDFNNKTLGHAKASLINATKLEYNIISNTYKPNTGNNVFFL